MNQPATWDECSFCHTELAPGTALRETEPWDGSERTWCNDSCRDNEAERAHERMLSDFYGGSAPMTQKERDEVAKRNEEAWL